MDFQSLASLYRTETGEELLELAGQLSSLTVEARAALSTELASRRISVEASLDAEPGPEQVDKGSVSTTTTTQQPIHAGAFIAEVLQFYNRNRGLFIALVFPAILLSTVAFLGRRHEVLDIGHHLPRGAAILNHKIEMLEIGLLTWGNLLFSWIIFCISFAATCVAVEQIEAGFFATFAESIRVTCARVRPLLVLCLLLFLMLIASVGTFLLISQAIIWLALEPRIGQLSSLTISLFSYTALGLGALVLSRFGLAVPALILDDCSVAQALLCSKHLTRGKTPVLLALLFKSIVGGYVAGMLPFWLAEWIPVGVNLPSWLDWALIGASVAAVTIVEPAMFIGFALLYLKTSSLASQTRKSAAAS